MVFVILIMFIVIAPMLELDRISLANGSIKISHESYTSKYKTPFKISVREDDSIWYNNHMLSLNQLKTALLNDIQAHDNKNIQLIQDKKASFGRYQEIKNLAEELQFQEIDILLKPV